MNHKRKRPKNRRGGCLLCKPWKMNGAPQQNRHRPSVRRQVIATSQKVKDALATPEELAEERWKRELFEVWGY